MSYLRHKFSPVGTKGPNGQWYGTPNQEITSYEKLAMSPTVKRVKPLDLFRHPVPRDVVVERVTGGTFSRTDSFGNTVVAKISYAAHLAYNTPPEWADWSKIESRIRAKIKNDNVNLAVSCAEYRSTCAMFAQSAARIYGAAKALKPGLAFGNVSSLVIRDRPIAKRPASKKVVNEWLQFQYGMIPLLSDLGGAAAALSISVIEGFPMYVSANERHNATPSGVSGNLATDAGYKWNAYVSYQKRIRARFFIRNAQLKRFTQVGLTNVAAAGWELIPYSFVLDQIVPIGKYLESLDAMVGVTDLCVQRSTMLESGAESVGKAGTVVGYTNTKTRLGLSTTLSLPPLRYQPSGSYTSVVNGLALLAQIRL